MMKKTIRVEYLRERINRLLNEYKDSIAREEAENRLSRNLESIAKRRSQIDGYRLVMLGIEKVDDLIRDITK